MYLSFFLQHLGYSNLVNVSRELKDGDGSPVFLLGSQHVFDAETKATNTDNDTDSGLLFVQRYCPTLEVLILKSQIL